MTRSTAHPPSLSALVVRHHRRVGLSRHRFRTGAALTGAAMLLANGAVWTSAPASAQAPGLNSVVMTVLDVSPSTPESSHTPRPLAVTLSLHNTTQQTLDRITVTADRGDPINSQSALDHAIGDPTPPNFIAPIPTASGKPLTVSLTPQATTQVVFRTTTDIPRDAGLCLCHDAIYPLFFTAHFTAQDGTTGTVGVAQTYLPVFGLATPKPVQVSWVWPLLDRPHRLIDADSGPSTSRTRPTPVFTDDDLATEVSTGGRLDDLLQVVERVGANVPLTLVVDPELIDELQVMTSGYKVTPAGGRTVAGTGGQAAADWLQRLRAVLDQNPQIELDFTPFADPDVEALTTHGLHWAVGLSQMAQDRVSTALGDRTPLSDISWPVGETIGLATLTALVRQGTQTVIVNDKALRGASGTEPVLDALAPVQTDAGPALAAVVSSTIERYVTKVLPIGGAGRAALPQLVSEVAVHAVESLGNSRYVVITAPRDVNPDPAVAAAAILATAHASWSRPLPLRAAAHTVTPVDHGPLIARGSGAGLPEATITAATYVTNALPGLRSLFTAAADANTVLGPLPAAVQRTESASWRSDPDRSAADAATLAGNVQALVDRVHLVEPANGTYTLTSINSPLPVSITNDLDVGVSVDVAVHAVGGVPGFSADDVGTRKVAAHSTIQVRIPTHVERTGRIQVRVTLTTPSELALGRPLSLSVHSTALGALGVIITVGAGVVLVLALLLQFIRRLRRGPSTPSGQLEPVAVA